MLNNDNFFEVIFGYKVNRMELPHIHVRTYWDYCKTIDVHISGNIPEEDMIKLRNIYLIMDALSGTIQSHFFMDYSN